MVKYFKTIHFLIIVMLVALVVPGTFVFAGTSRQGSTPTLTATPQLETPLTGFETPAAPGVISTPPVVFPEVSSIPTIQPSASYSIFKNEIPGMTQLSYIKAQLPDTVEVLSFSDFEMEETTMRGPFAASGYYFDLPMNWKLNRGGVLRLVLDVYYTGVTPAMEPSHGTAYGGALLVQYNYTNIGVVDLGKEGRIQVDFPLSLEVLNALGTNKGQSIQLILDSGVNCDVDFRTTVVVRDTSQIFLPHDVLAPPVDLRGLPAPFYQRSFNQDTALIVVPDNPNASELQSALSVAAGFGRMTYSQLLISVLPVGQVPVDILESVNLIFVGKAENFPILEQVSLPAPVSNGAFDAKDSSPTDGVIQMAVSPWNPSKVIMVVGGSSDEGVAKAGFAVSTGMVHVGSNPSLSLVSGTQMMVTDFNPADVNRTFEDLGYDSVVVGETGMNLVSYSFDIPQNYIIGPDAYLDLNFSHTALLEYQRSTIVVMLNGQPVGSVRLSDQTLGQGNAKIYLPASAARPGINILQLEINLEPMDECVNPLIDGLWMRIDSSSSLHLPFVLSPTSSSILLDLGKYPAPFAFDPTMKDLAFVLADNDPIGWNIAAQLAFRLGNTGMVQIAGLNAYYADNVPENVRQERNLIIVGRPSKLPILFELYSDLPAPFEPGTDLATEENLQGSNRLSPDVDMGYLELLPAPWNSKRTILLVGGSSDLGLRWAGAALQYGRYRGRLKGDLAFINGEQIVTADTRVMQEIQGIMATAVPVDVTPQPVGLQPVQPGGRDWILPAVFASAGGIALILLILAVQAIGRRRSRK